MRACAFAVNGAPLNPPAWSPSGSPSTPSRPIVVCFAINIGLRRPFVESLLFALALAVGLTPQMLSAIVTLSLSKGARQMATQRVIVKRLDAIEDVGSLDVLCTDKTGTLTTGAVALERAERIDGTVDGRVAVLAWWNARHQTSFDNPIDDAVLAAEGHGHRQANVAQADNGNVTMHGRAPRRTGPAAGRGSDQNRQF